MAVVFKLGGSLLDVPELAARLARAIRGAAQPLLVVGGGAAADVVRGWDRTHSLGDERAHRLALQSMRLTQALAAELLPESAVVTDRPTAQAAWDAGRVPIIDALAFLEREEAAIRGAAIRAVRGDIPTPLRPLPASWDVTSDSIAAWIAARWPADRLVLLKSVDEPAGWRSGELGPPAVDPWLARLAPFVPVVDWINLRA